MTIKEAIKEIEDYLATGYLLGNPKLRGAVELSILALNEYKKAQVAGWYPPGYMLPGETEK